MALGIEHRVDIEERLRFPDKWAQKQHVVVLRKLIQSSIYLLTVVAICTSAC